MNGLLPLFLSLSPALVAIGLALATRRVVPSLGAGVLVGGLAAHLPALSAGDLLAPLRAVLGFLLDAVAPGLAANLGVTEAGATLPEIETSHLAITAFSLAVAATVGLLSASGGTRALVRLVEGAARGPRGAQIAAWLAGTLVFFDDYANCLVVGSAMGPVFDRFRVSRAKLSYIVDCTAAPVASLALVSTWIGYQVGLLGEELEKAGQERSAFDLFLSAWPYGFYGLFTLAMVGAVAWTGRDFGPMLKEEAKARAFAPKEPAAAEAGGEPYVGAWVALVPVGALLALTLGILAVDGAAVVIAEGATEGRDATAALLAAGPGGVLSEADPYGSLVISSFSALALAFLTTLGSKGLTLHKVPRALRAGLHPMGEALTVLLLAWSLGNAMGATGAGDRLLELLAPDDRVTVRADEARVPLLAQEAAVSARLRALNADGSTLAQVDVGPVPAGVSEVAWTPSAGPLPPAGEYRIAVEALDDSGEPVRVLVRGSEKFPSWMLPAVVFLVAAGTSFATGTSFGTMGILIPLAVPLALGVATGPYDPVLLGSVGAVLAGAIFGDHASPISDTTVLSALGSGVDLMTHVRTQLPYALLAGAVSLALGYVPAGLGVSPWLLLVVGSAAVLALVVLLGTRLPDGQVDRPSA